MNINLHIEKLVLAGIQITPGQQPLFQAALEAELSQLLSANGLATELTRAGNLPKISAPNLPANGENNPTQLGQQIARAVYGGIGDTRSTNL